MERSSGFGVADVTIDHAVDAEIGLDRIFLGVQILTSLAGRGGEAPFPNTRFQRADGTIGDLLPSIQQLKRLGLVEARLPLVHTAQHGYAQALIRLTDRGHNVCAELAHKRIRVGTIREVPIGQVLADGEAELARIAETARD